VAGYSDALVRRPCGIGCVVIEAGRRTKVGPRRRDPPRHPKISPLLRPGLPGVPGLRDGDGRLFFQTAEIYLVGVGDGFIYV
jgi:hypothetical protein